MSFNFDIFETFYRKGAKIEMLTYRNKLDGQLEVVVYYYIFVRKI